MTYDRMGSEKHEYKVYPRHEVVAPRLTHSRPHPDRFSQKIIMNNIEQRVTSRSSLGIPNSKLTELDELKHI